MGLFSKDKDSDAGAGSGDGGTLGTPGTDSVEDVPSNDDATMVVSGGGVADTSGDDATAAGERGLG
ncbi:MAG: hypothetical protein JWM62_2433 [Frankiales bacterium]|jgi:hypothetical protein|nr:hypothetical protein [Frankiales bacterium]